MRQDTRKSPVHHINRTISNIQFADNIRRTSTVVGKACQFDC